MRNDSHKAMTCKIPSWNYTKKSILSQNGLKTKQTNKITNLSATINEIKRKDNFREKLPKPMANSLKRLLKLLCLGRLRKNRQDMNYQY